MVNSNQVSESNSWRKSILALLLILGLGVAVRILHWSPSADGDEARYINHAIALAHGTVPEYFDGAVAVRIPYLAMLAAWGKVFGFSTVALQASGIATYVVATFLLWVLTARLYDGPTASVTSFLFTLLPLHIHLSTHALTDDLAFYAALAAVIVLMRARDRVRGEQSVTGEMLLVGFLTGFSIGIRQPYVLLPVVGAAWLLSEKGDATVLKKGALSFLAGAGIYVLLEMIGFQLWLGDYLFRFRHDVAGTLASSDQPAVTTLGTVEKLFRFRDYFPRLLPSGSFSFVPLLAVIAFVDRLGRRDKRALLPALWSLIFLFYFFWGSTSLTSWSLPAVNPRYLLPTIALASVLVAAFLVDLNRAYRFTPFTIGTTALAFSAVSVWIVAYNMKPNCVTDMIKAVARSPSAKGTRLGYPESIKRCFLPMEFWGLLDDFRLIPDEKLAQLESLDLSCIDGLIVPNESFYRYAHIGVVDALERTKDWWEVEPIIGPKWPRYLTITGKPSNRVVGHIYWLKRGKENALPVQTRTTNAKTPFRQEQN